MEYQIGDTVPLYATFVQYTGEVAIISGVPTVTVFHRAGVNTIIDLNHGNMSLLSGVTYFYNYVIPAKTDLTNYEVRYDAIFSGTSLTNVVGGEGFRTVPSRFFEGKVGGMVKDVRITKKDTWKEEEKDAVLDVLSKLGEKFKLLGDTELIGRFDSLATSIGDLKQDKEIIKEERRMILEELGAVKSNIGGKQDLESISKLFDGLAIVEKRLANIDTELRKERMATVLSSIEDIRIELDELKRAVVAALPIEALERLKDGRTS